MGWLIALIAWTIRLLYYGVPLLYLLWRFANYVFLSPCIDLEGKHVLIVGGSNALDMQIACKCAAEGADVRIIGNNKENLKSIKKEFVSLQQITMIEKSSNKKCHV